MSHSSSLRPSPLSERSVAARRGSQHRRLLSGQRAMGAAMAAGLLWIVGGCSQPSDEFLDPLDMATGEQPDASTKLDGSTAMGELPCEVRDLLAKHCQSCHSDSPKGAPVALMTYAQLTAPSKADPKKTYAERSLARMQDMTRPMPPAPTATVPQAEISAFSAWVSAGRPSQKCQTMQPDDPFAKPPMCSSGKTYMGGTPKDEMNPGLACITCHKSKGKAADVTLAGTVYITGHEPDRCLGGPASGMPMATVEITDANKRVIPLAVNASGNFVYRSTMPIALPYTAVVKWNGKTREMKTPQMNGDCNSCHTQDGINGAPGRVVLP